LTHLEMSALAISMQRAKNLFEPTHVGTVQHTLA